MCDKRTELDKKIEHCLRIAFSLNDQLTVDRIKTVIAELEARKKTFIQNKRSKAASVGGLFTLPEQIPDQRECRDQQHAHDHAASAPG